MDTETVTREEQVSDEVRKEQIDTDTSDVTPSTTGKKHWFAAHHDDVVVSPPDG